MLENLTNSIEIKDVSVAHSAGYGIMVKNVPSVLIHKCTVADNEYANIWVEASDNLVVKDNMV